MNAARPRIAVFAPNPMLAVTIEARGGAGDDIHCHPAGQGVWLARMAAEMGAEPALCSLLGGETGALLEPMLEAMPGERHLVRTATPSGAYVTDRRRGERELIAYSAAGPPSRHEADELVSATSAAALGSAVLVVCNPYPDDLLPLETYSNLVANASAAGIPAMVDLSSPRLDAAAAAGPDLVKINDWELAEFVAGPVSEPGQMRAACERLLALGARAVMITRAGDPAFYLDGEMALEVTPPKFERGSREGCGDTMMGAIAAATAAGADRRRALALGAAAGAVNFLRHGLGTGSRAEVEEIAERVAIRQL